MPAGLRCPARWPNPAPPAPSHTPSLLSSLAPNPHRRVGVWHGAVGADDVAGAV